MFDSAHKCTCNRKCKYMVVAVAGAVMRANISGIAAANKRTYDHTHHRIRIHA